MSQESTQEPTASPKEFRHDFHKLNRLPPYILNVVTELARKARRAGEDIVDLGMGNPDLPTAPHIVEKLIDTARRGDTHGYSASRGINGLRKAQEVYGGGGYMEFTGAPDYKLKNDGIEPDPESDVPAALVAEAQKAVDAGQATEGSYDQTKKRLEDLHLPIGWSKGWGAPLTRLERNDEGFSPWNDVFGPLIGWLITAFAATLGAPFWFDVLNKFMVIRSTVKPREKSQEEGSEDRPATSSRPTASPTAPHAAYADFSEGNEDECGVGELAATPDERLPAARGGVA